MRLLRVSSLIALLALVLAACGTQQVTADEVMRRMEAARAALNTAHVVADVVVDAPAQPERSGTFSVEAWVKKTGATDVSGEPIVKIRAKVLNASGGDERAAELVGTEMVNDGETVWLYNPKENKVVTGKLSDLKGEGASGEDRTAQMMQLQEMLQQIIDASNVEIVNNSEQVAGKTTWRIKLTPKPETEQQLGLGSLVQTTLWVDQASDLPVKAEINADELGKATAQAITLDLNQDIADDMFVFTPPAGAEIVDAAELAKQVRPQAATLDEARAQVDFPVLAPSQLPQGVQADGVQVLNRGGASVIQNFSGAFNFSLVQTAGEFPGEGNAPAGADTQTVEVRGQQATLITSGGDQGGTLLRWRENGVTIVIAGTLNAEQATTIATGLLAQ